MRDQIEKVLQALKGHFGTSIFSNPRQFKAALADMPIETDAKKIRKLLNIAICDMKAYSRLESGLANNNLFIVNNLVAEMVSDHWPEESSAQMAIESIASLLGYTPKSPPKSTKQPKAAATQQTPQTQSATPAMNDPILKRVFIFLEDSDWDKADEYCERVLDANPENAMAYVGKLCAELKVKNEAGLANCNQPLDNILNYEKTIRYADTNCQTRISGYNQAIRDRIAEEERRERERIAEQKRLEQERIQQEQTRRAEEERREKERFAEQKRLEQERIQQEQARRAEEERQDRERESKKIKKYQEDMEKWQDEVNRKQEQFKKWKSQKLCPHCGGSKASIFSRTCKACGIEFSMPVRVRIPEHPIAFCNYKWRVLEAHTDKVLIITETIVEQRPYNTERTDVTWETCSLRKYLNGEFLQKFTKGEQGRIIKTQIVNRDNQWYGTKGGSTTNDSVFLLSLEEVVKYFGDSGQLENKNLKDEYWFNDKYNAARIAKGAEGKACWWWLRSPGYGSNGAAHVGPDGNVYVNGLFVHIHSGGVRPALWLNL